MNLKKTTRMGWVGASCTGWVHILSWCTTIRRVLGSSIPKKMELAYLEIEISIDSVDLLAILLFGE